MLHIKHRPNTWEQVIGNKEAVAYLQSALENEKRPHSYLITGPTGSGKTTLARIFAKELGCNGSDLQEVDVADYRGIDSVREIRRQMFLAPMMGACRVWIMDECHQQTKEAMSALLKALEDTPPHVYFILATTDPQKLLPTIRNRCTPLSVYSLREGEMARLLNRVAKAEQGEPLPAEVLDEIVGAAEGCPRQALIFLEKYISDPETEIGGLDTPAEVIDLCRALARPMNWSNIRPILVKLKGEDPEKIRRAVLGYSAATMLKKDSKQALVILDIFKDPFYNSGWPGLVWACALSIQK